jgi:hypothetical protein
LTLYYIYFKIKPVLRITIGANAMAIKTTEDIRGNIELVVVNLEDLGFKNPARRDAICERAKEMGLDPVPPDFFGNNPKAFYAMRAEGGRLLTTNNPDPHHLWGINSQWPFVRPKQS